MLGFPGLGDSSDPMPSGDPVLPGDLASGFMAGQIRDSVVDEQRRSMLGGRLEQKIEGLMEVMMASLATKVSTKLRETPEGGQNLRDMQQGVPSGGPASPTPVRNPAQEANDRAQAAALQPQSRPGWWEASSPQPAPTSGAEDADVRQAYREGRQAIQGMTMSGAIQRAAAPLARMASERTAPWEQIVDPYRGTPVYVRREPSDPGEPPGEIIEQVSPESDPSKFAHIRRTTFAGSALGALASGKGGAAGALGATVARVAGPIGMAVGGAALVGNTLEGQLERASTYRQIYGEQDTSMFAGRERFGEWMAGVQGFGTLGGDRAREQYQRASALGLRGDRREGATDFAGDMYQRFGMDTGESMAIVEQATRQGNVSLRDFSEAITEVSRAAVDAGRSSQEAIKDFVAAQDYVATNLVAGTGSVAATEQIEAVADQMPTALRESIGGTKGLAGMVTQQGVMQMAALSGGDPMAAWGAIRGGDTGAIGDFVAQTGDQLLNLSAPLLGMAPEQLKSALKEATGGEKVSVEQQGQILLQLVGGDAARLGQFEIGLSMVARQLGIPGDRAQLFNLLFEAASGGFGSTQQEKQQGFSMADKMLGGLLTRGSASDSSSPYSKVSKPTTEQAMAAGYGGGSSEWSQQRGDILSNLGYSSTQMPRDEGAFNAYVEHVAKTGQQNSLIESILGSGNLSSVAEAAGVSDPGSAKYRINVGGKSKELSLSEIISKGYMGSLGSAEILRSDRPGDNPASLRIELDLTPDAKRLVLQQDGPSEDQRNGVPSSSSGGLMNNSYGSR